MDENTLIGAFQASLGADNEARKQAQEYLTSVQSTPGLVSLLLKIALSNQPLEVQQMAVIYLKNLTKVWRDSKRSFYLPPEDKLTLRNNIIYCLKFSIPEKIRSQFEEIAHNIAKVDYPWDEVHQQIGAALDSGNIEDIYAALSIIFQIARVYEFVMNEKRSELKNLVSLYFDKLDTLLTSLLSEQNEDAFKFMTLILQIFWVCFYIELPEEQATAEKLNSWFGKFKQILELDLGELESPSIGEEDTKQREQHPKWQCKRWAAQIVHRLFNRYFNIGYLKEHNKFIGQHFQSNWAVPYTHTIVPILFKRTHAFIPNIVLNYLVKFCTQAIKFQPTCEMLISQVPKLITDIIMPLLCRVPSDETLWKDNPIEFIRKEADLGRAYYSAKSSSIDMLITLCEKGYLDQFIEYVAKELSNSPDLLRKDAILLAVGSLQQIIREHKKYESELENLLYNYVLQEFDNSVGFLRARACWMYAQFSVIDFQNEEHQSLALSKVCGLMIDPDLPVRIEAATALPRLMNWKMSHQRIGGEIQQLLEVYLKLMNEIDSEELVDSLEDIVGRFANEIVPYAMGLTDHLIQAFLRMASQDSNQDDGESAMAAVSTLNTIAKIVDALEERHSDLLTVSRSLQPVFEYALSEKGCEYFEEALHILTCLLYYSPPGHLPHLFGFLNYIKLGLIGSDQVKAYGKEQLEEAFSPIANFIAKYNDMAVQETESILQLAFQLMKEEYQDIVTGCKIEMAFLENSRGKVDPAISRIVSETLEAFNRAASRGVKIVCWEVVCVAFWYNPLLTLQALEQYSATQSLLTFAVENVEMFKENMSKIHTIYGLGSLLSVSEQLPQPLAQNLGFLCKNILLLFKKLKEDNEELGPQEPGESPFVEEGKFDAEFNKILEKIRASREQGDLDDEDEDFRFGTEPEDLYDSPFEGNTEGEFLKGLFQNMAQRNPELYNNMQSALAQEEMAVLQEVLSN